ncbi:alpha-(1,3)-fucosyltransferase c-like [Plakobranchus ocellatus]|uniref:Fucosyltransferase n=1 Tax=Plakobranchus ocellatus TaxID=259542 RepID=A0AAV4C460_9GAST|nr:alpha-(1,3)-fucosyltransferase c-like [Plakobranchus ocellatus]
MWASKHSNVFEIQYLETRDDHYQSLASEAQDDKFKNHTKHGNQPSKYPAGRVKKFFYINRRPNKKDCTKFTGCKYSACAKTSKFEEADVVILNPARMKKVQELPAKRPGQIWVMQSREPTNLPSMETLGQYDLDNKVNFTMMIFSDSTWPVRLGSLKERPLPNKDYDKIFQAKRFEVAWFVSECDRPSRRMEYVKRMMSSVDVHIYGKCGNMTCGSKGYRMGGKKDLCLSLLSRDYKFYLSFENTFCRDYVTEKFYDMFKEVDVIPVVRGGVDYTKLFPPGIFINAKDFPSPESLGSYLQSLAKNKQAYVAMLKEKNRYIKDKNPRSLFYCDLCKIAHTGEPNHIYPSFLKWVRKPDNCWKPTDLK